MATALQSATFGELLLWVAAFFVGASGLSLAIGFTLERALPGRRIWALPLDPGQLRHELIGNCIFISIAVVTFVGVLGGRVLVFGPESLVRGALTFGALSFGFQAFYYGLHRAMHRRSLVRFHRWHHASRVTTPLSGQSMSWVEALGWMLGYLGLPLLFSWIVPISATGWVSYVAFNVFGNIVGHANVELEPHNSSLRWKAMLTNALVFHALHHARWNGHYGFAAALMDRLFRTEWPDWLQLHQRVTTGKPLTDLRQRVDLDQR
jgi:lathosterol oxidase